MKKGCKYGSHRVIEPKGVLPQAAVKIDNGMEIYDNEILLDVLALNIDSASFTQLKNVSGQDPEKVKTLILDIVNDRGKMQNPVTGSGGMLIGIVKAIGDSLKGKVDIKEGDRVATLVSLSLTPLKIESINQIHMNIDRVDITGQAILFESGIYAKLPDDMNEGLALAALDVAGAPAQVAKLVKPGDSVFILGASGKSGMLCAYEAMKRVGPTGKVIGGVIDEANKKKLEALNLCHEYVVGDACNAMDMYNQILEVNHNKEVDIAVNCVNVGNTEMSTILPVRDEGVAYFFSMATSFTKATLGAEGVGKDVTMIMGNGYTKGHAQITLEELRENKPIRDFYERIYVGKEVM